MHTLYFIQYIFIVNVIRTCFCITFFQSMTKKNCFKIIQENLNMLRTQKIIFGNDPDFSFLYFDSLKYLLWKRPVFMISYSVHTHNSGTWLPHGQILFQTKYLWQNNFRSHWGRKMCLQTNLPLFSHDKGGMTGTYCLPHCYPPLSAIYASSHSTCPPEGVSEFQLTSDCH